MRCGREQRFVVLSVSTRLVLRCRNILGEGARRGVYIYSNLEHPPGLIGGHQEREPPRGP